MSRTLTDEQRRQAKAGAPAGAYLRDDDAPWQSGFDGGGAGD
jgi:hypothetical protein